MIKKSISKILVVLILIGLNWTGISAVVRTFAYFNDTENSSGSFAAGGLDFYLTSPSDFSPGAIAPGESAERTISFLNNDNIPKYKVKTVNPSGTLCDYLTLQVKLDGVDVGYNGLLIGFDYGPVVFEAPEDWTFILTLPADAPEPAQGQTCNFNFLFYGSQTENNLPFGGGFNDTEEDISNIASKICQDTETRSKGYWKNHSEVFIPYLSQMLGDESVDTVLEAVQILNYNNDSSSMRNKLKGQLLAMKFNIAHFSVGEYFVVSAGKTINQIVAEADDLLSQVPEPSEGILEAMKDLLDDLNQDLQIRICSLIPLLTFGFESQLILNDIVLNEFLPNPEGEAYGYDFGEDDDSMPKGEWVELYNNSDVSYDLSGWYIWDASGDDLNKISITNLNTYPANTIISGKSWLVVYMNKEVLDNTGDTVKLFNNADTLIDFYAYTGVTPPNKSYARIPDGTGGWVDPIPTPGRRNILEDENAVFEPVITELDRIDEGIGESTTTTETNPVEEELIIIDDLFLAFPSVNFSDIPSDEESVIEEETSYQEEPVVEENPNTKEELTGEELLLVEEQIISEENTETFEGTTENATEEVIEEVADEPIINEIEEEIIEEINEEMPIIEEPVVEEPIVEEAPIDEVLTIDPIESPSGVQVNEEQPVTVPDQSLSVQEVAAESPSDSNDTGDSVSE